VRALFLHERLSSGRAGWFATHPPVEARVAALVRFAGGRDPGKLPDLPPEEARRRRSWSSPQMHQPSPRRPGSAPPMMERLDAIAAFNRTNDSTYMKNQAKREKARRAGLDPDSAAPPPPFAD
jgi:heat shock protein HtpX